MGKALFPYATVAKLEIHEMIWFHKVQTYPFKPGLNKTKISLSSLSEKLFRPSKRCDYNVWLNPEKQNSEALLLG